MNLWNAGKMSAWEGVTAGLGVRGPETKQGLGQPLLSLSSTPPTLQGSEGGPWTAPNTQTLHLALQLLRRG